MEHALPAMKSPVAAARRSHRVPTTLEQQTDMQLTELRAPCPDTISSAAMRPSTSSRSTKPRAPRDSNPQARPNLDAMQEFKMQARF